MITVLVLYLITTLIAAIGLTLIYGAYARWRWLVDPPTDMRFYYSQAVLKRVFGVRFVVVYTYCLGLMLIAFAVWVVVARWLFINP